MTPHCEDCKKPIRIKFGHDDLMPHGGWCMCLSEASRKDAGGARPASDVDALIERCKAWAAPECPASRIMLDDRELRDDMNAAAAALVQLRDSEALARGQIAEQMIEIARLTERLTKFNEARERAEARVEQRDKQIAVYNNGGFADADALAEKFIDLTNRIAALEAEREAANERAGKHLADFYDMRNQRDALKAALRKWAVSRHTNKCYICDWSWSEGAPQIHSAKCLCYGGADNDN